MPRKTRSLVEVKNKEGRLDCLLYGAADLLTKKLEDKLSLPGLAEGLMPLAEKEIRKNVDSRSVVPEEYRKLTNVIGRYINNKNVDE